MVRKQWLAWSSLAFVALVASALLYYFTWIGAFDSRTVAPLNEVEAMRAIYDTGEKDVRFSVPRENWPDILDALTPAEKDDAPMKWQGIGTLVITKRGGHQVAVDLFSLDKPPGAFRVWTCWWRVYYRGGDSAKLDAALRAAYEASLPTD
jgi:hypothetical protein